ncbi:MAG: hypothetical protein U0791_02545 [Gemmataceae bacterium]
MPSATRSCPDPSCYRSAKQAPLFGPHGTTPTGAKKPTKLIAFLDDASRVLCHGEFFFDETVDTLRAAFYKRCVPEQLLVDNGSMVIGIEIRSTSASNPGPR